MRRSVAAMAALLLLTGIGLAGCSRGPKYQDAWNSCMAADAAGAAFGDAYVGTRPAYGQWPPVDNVLTQEYATGVVDFSTTIDGVYFTCLYDSKSDSAKISWG